LKQSSDDKLEISSNDLENVMVGWTHGVVTTADLSPYYRNMNFTSNFAKSSYGAGTTYMAHKIKFSLGSEHSIEGKFYDLEMQIIYIAKNPQNGHMYSTISVLFNRTNYQKLEHKQENAIDDFFTSLELKKVTEANKNSVPLNHTAQKVKIGSLMKNLNLKRRWIYAGSTT